LQHALGSINFFLEQRAEGDMLEAEELNENGKYDAASKIYVRFVYFASTELSRLQSV
jgi:hypothetical protein